MKVILTAILPALFLVSCGTTSIPTDHVQAHLYPVDSDSLFYPYPEKTASVGDVAWSEDLLSRRIGALDSIFQKERPREILLFLHGGMNDEKTGIEGGIAKYRAIRESSGGARIMPIFVTWDSGLGSSYMRHSGGDENGIAYYGKQSSKLKRWGTRLVNIPTDLATGIVQTPKTWLGGVVKSSQASNSLYGMNPDMYPTRSAYERTLKQVFSSFSQQGDPTKGFYKPKGGPVPWSASLANGNASINIPKTISAVVWTPVTAALAPAYQGIGRPAWENMSRRSHTLVHRYPTLIGQDAGGSQSRQGAAADGVLATILKKVAHWQRQQPGLKVTVVGHSMGTMALNEAFRGMEATPSSAETPPESIPYIRIDRIVYLAAACSIRDFNDSAGQYLMRNPVTTCYNLCLHPAREVKEENPSNAAPVVLSGSLLMWIDEFFESPRDFQGRTMGSFENCIIAYRHMPNTARFSLKAFADDAPWSGDSKSGPQKHGQFASYPFWKESFVTPCPPDQKIAYDPVKP